MVLFDQIDKLLAVNGKSWETRGLEVEATHVREECMAHRPLRIPHVLEICDTLAGGLPLLCSKGDDDLGEEDGEDHLLHLVS